MEKESLAKLNLVIQQIDYILTSQHFIKFQMGDVSKYVGSVVEPVYIYNLNLINSTL